MTWKFKLCVGFLIYLKILPSVRAQSQTVNVALVHEERNPIGARAMEVAQSYIRRNPRLGIRIGGYYPVRISTEEDARVIFEDLCATYSTSVREGKPPHLWIDFTMNGIPSESVKTFTAGLGVPTVSASFGQDGQLMQWANLDGEQHKYLVQVNPPADMIPEVIQSIVLAKNLDDVGVLYDNTFIMDHRGKFLRSTPARHMFSHVEDVRSIRRKMTQFRDLNFWNLMVLGNLTTIKLVLENANNNKFFSRKYTWHVITQDKGPLRSDCANATFTFVRPEINPENKERLSKLRTSLSFSSEPEITATFYFELIIRSLLAIKSMLSSREWPKNMNFITCEEYSSDNVPIRVNLDLRKHLRKVSERAMYAPFIIGSNGHSFEEFVMRLDKVTVVNGQIISAKAEGSWKASYRSPILTDANALANFSSATNYRIVTALQHPFVMREKDEHGNWKFSGYCIDLIEEIKRQIGFDYEIYIAPDNSFGNLDDDGQWNGMIKELVEKRADIALGSLSLMAERENVVDFTVPFYDLVGITILMKKQEAPTSMFKFLTVLEKDVWICIIIAYFITSILMWVFDRWSPYSYQNNREKYEDDEEKREFTLRECLWFCMTSLTPQGGGAAPKNLSGRLVAATWWLFGFIIIASYTANLAAFLTVSRLETSVESLDDLSKQYKIQYAPLNGSAAMTFFKRMAEIEARFYEIWKDMSLNDSLTPVERAKLAVWDYPVGDKYTKMWQAMYSAGLPNTMEEAVARVRKSKSSSEGFALLGDATDIRYQEMTNCDLQMVGEEFSRKPYAIAVQQGSPIKDLINEAILLLLNKRRLDKLKDIWWNQNKMKKSCAVQTDQSEGISIYNIGGVFFVIFVGIGFACITLVVEFWWYKYKSYKAASKESLIPGRLSYMRTHSTQGGMQQGRFSRAGMQRGSVQKGSVQRGSGTQRVAIPQGFKRRSRIRPVNPPQPNQLLQELEGCPSFEAPLAEPGPSVYRTPTPGFQDQYLFGDPVLP